MNDLSWLVHHRFNEMSRSEHSWRFVFDRGVVVTAECLWRLIENGRIRFTSRDDGHKFGLPAPVDVVLEVNQKLSNATTALITLHEGTLDLEIQFETGHVLQLIPDSSGYESWTVNDATREFIAVGGGKLAVLDGPTKLP